MASFSFNEIELDYECDHDPWLCDSIPIFKSMLTLVSLPTLDPIPEPTLIPVPIELEIEPLILESHIPLMRKEWEFQFFGLDPIFEPNPTLEFKFDLIHIPESVLVPEYFTLEPKSTILPSHILLLDQGMTKMTPRWYFKIDHITEMILMLGFCMIQFSLVVVKMKIRKSSSEVGSLKLYII